MPHLPNPGHLPDDCLVHDEHGNVTGHRGIHVRLFNGWDSKASGNAPWPSAGGRPPTVWTISRPPHPFEIREFEVM
ncbi:hypothetical protein [Novosphingobium sp.]|uniref:hypothetical protein n=1 Tax=Novosphingobium sp. TaxID=1874826 RepID=UPI00352A92F5